MTTLVLGATGATGRLVVDQLLQQGQKVTALVRPQSSLSEELLGNPDLELAKAEISSMSETEIQTLVAPCDNIICCLGHNLSFKGVYGHPRLLVTQAIKRVCEAAKLAPGTKERKVVLMNTSGNHNRNLNEPRAFKHKLVMGLLHVLLPPHRDNVKAAEFLRKEIGPDDDNLQWVIVRPDNLTDAEEVTEYDSFESPIRDAIFDAGQTSRINVAHFMTELISKPELWQQWCGKMPVLYNSQR